jgi:hypothetical protein
MTLAHRRMDKRPIMPGVAIKGCPKGSSILLQGSKDGINKTIGTKEKWREYLLAIYYNGFYEGKK